MLIILKLGCNKITDEGAQHLARAFENNRVNLILSFFPFALYIQFLTDTRHTRSESE
jgi:hypothetical protein